MTYDKDEVKDTLEDEDVFEILERLNAEPEDHGDYFICKTICHGGDSHKLYYYCGSRLFKCYTHCSDTFDIFGLIQRVEHVELNEAISFVVAMFNLSSKLSKTDYSELSEDWKLFKRYHELSDIEIKRDKIILPEIDRNLILHYPQPRFLNWENEHIPKEVCDFMDIHYDPINGGILIPHTDENNRVVGIRERTLIQENEIYGKYRPWKNGKKLYTHPLAFNLYGLFAAKDNITNMRTAIVYESEKAVLQTINYLGIANTIGVAVCGSSISKYQFQLLQELNISEMCIGFDADYERVGDAKWDQMIQRLQKIYNKFSPFVNVSFLLDIHGDKLGYKQSPTDCGKQIFMDLWRDRIFL